MLFFRPEDLGLRRFFASGRVKDDEILQDAQALVVRREPVPAATLAGELPLSDTKLATAMHHLVDAGFAEVRDGQLLASRDADLSEAVEHAGEADEHREAVDRSRVEMVRAYAETDGCRRAFLLGYFGEACDPPCGNCDVCERAADAPAAEAGTAPFSVADRVLHDTWGAGSVARIADGKLTVVFDTAVTRRWTPDLVVERDLLAAYDGGASAG